MSWAATATAGIGVAGSLLSKPNSSKTSTKDPKYLADAKENVVGRATDLSNRKYEDYGGDRVAGISDNEKSALDLAATGNAQARGYLNKAGAELDEASALEFNQENLDKYMNPYVDSVLQPQLREQNKQYERSKTALTNSKGGAWGGDRSAFAASELENNQREAIADVTGKTYSDAYDSATKNFFNDANRKSQSAAAYQKLGEGVQNLNRDDIQNLMATGGTDRLLKQAGLDADYAEFIERRDWDVNNLDTLLQAIGAAGGNSTTTRTEGSNGAVGTILGAGATLAGMYFTGKTQKQGSSGSYGGTTGVIPAEAGGG